MSEIIEEITKEITEEVVINEQDLTNDPYTLKVRGGDIRSPDPEKRPTDPVGLSRSILHVLSSNPSGYCKVLSVGSTALSSAMAGFRLATTAYTSRTKGTVLVMTQSEYTAKIAGNPTRGVCTRIFPIPVSCQV